MVHVAILVDADQHHVSLRAIRAQAATQGSVVLAEAFTDWDSTSRAPWKTFAWKSHFRLKHVPPGKQSTDRAIVARVEELLARGDIDAFWIASSDRDFAAVAQRILAAKRLVTLVLATARFPRELQPTLRIVDPYARLPEDWAREAERRIMAAYHATPRRDGVVLLSELQARLTALDPEFSWYDFGFGSLLDLLRSLPDAFVARGDANGGAVRVERATSHAIE